MSNSCALNGHVKNSKGEVVQSKLWNDLLHHLSDRETTKEFYKVGTDNRFLDKVKDKAQFDENGEITFNSLRKLAKIDVKQEKLIATLNDDIGSGIMEYDDAITKLLDFNRNSQFKDDYMATIKKKDNKYELFIVPKTTANQVALEQEVSNRTLRDRILYHLNKAGVSTEFLEKDDKENGRYSTINAKRTADGLYNLIRVAKGEHLTESLAEEAGHFAIASLGNSPLVQRLINSLTPEAQRKIFGDEYDKKVMGVNSRRETAGYLVGKAIMDEVDKTTSWGRLAHKVLNLAKRIFNTFKGDDIANAVIKAEATARKIARDFMLEEGEGSIENALKIKETLYSAESSLNTRTYRDVVNKLSLAITELKTVSNKNLQKKMEAILGNVESGRSTTVNNNPNSSITDAIALEGITEAASLICDMLGQGKEINNLLDSVDFLNTADFYGNMAENGRKLRQVHIFVTAALNLQQLIASSINNLPGKQSLKGDINNVQLLNEKGDLISLNLNKINRELAEATNYLLAELMVKEKQYYLKFCETTLGEKYVYRASRVIWNLTGKKKNPEGKTKRFYIQKGGRVDISSALENMESDINMFERYLASMSNNSDIIGQIADKCTKEANMIADKLTNITWDNLRVLLERFKAFEKYGIKQESMYERFDDGSLTGNIISEFHWGTYEKDWKEFKDKHFELFKQSVPNLEDLTEFEKAIRWQAYFKPHSKEWHKEHSTWDAEIGRYIPNDLYENKDFKELMDKYSDLKVWYKDFMDIKKGLDSLLPEGSTLSVRMPQFKGTFTNIIRNQQADFTAATKKGIRSKVRDTFCVSSEDTDFGSDMTYNSEEEERFANALAYEKEKIHRLPIFGVNKLQNMSELSTDIFRSTLAYASMAYTYKAMDQVVNTFEVGKEVLAQRTVAGNKTEEERTKQGGSSRAYNRYLKFVDKQVYGISSSKTVIPGKIVIEKVVSAITSFASRYFLGGNVIGGTVNTGTGAIELIKEAAAGEHFTPADLKAAHKMYWSSFGKNWWHYGDEFKEDRVSLFIRHFNIRGDNRNAYRNWDTTNPTARRIYNMFSESIYLPYKTGDHYMQTMSYLAMAHRIKVYDEDGNKIRLWDAYQVKDNTDDKGNTSGKTLKLDGIFFKSRAGVEEYKMITSILEQLKGSSSSGPFGSTIHLTQEQKDYLDKKDYNIASTANTIQALENDAKDLTWSTDDESAFMDKCREINNRMHGIYNNQDKTAFQQNWYGNALLSMRGYALGLLERRISANKYNVALGHDTEGSLNTLCKVIASTSLDAEGCMKTLRAIFLPMTKAAKLDMYRMGFSKNQIANMKRNLGDCIFISLLYLLKCLVAKGNDDDDDNLINGYVYYFASRLLREQAAYNNPIGMWNEVTTVTDLTPSGMAALVDISTLGIEFAGIPLSKLPFVKENEYSFFYKSSKEDKYKKGDPKAFVHFWRVFPYIRNSYMLKQPYEAAASYEYGQKLRQR